MRFVRQCPRRRHSRRLCVEAALYRGFACRREARRRLREARAIEREAANADPRWVDVDIVGLGAVPTCTGVGVPQELLKPGGRESTIWCRYGYCGCRSVIVRDTPDTRTPTWWRRRVQGDFSLTLHPFGLAGVKRDPGRGVREAVSLGSWPGNMHLPDLPVGEAPQEVTLQGPTGPAKAHRVGLGANYVIAAAVWLMMAPRAQSRPPADVWVQTPDGRRVLHALSTPAPDGRQVYVAKGAR